jgi:folate-binding protein YgfZ
MGPWIEAMNPPDDPSYSAAVSRAAIFDLSNLGKLILRGPDAPDFLHRLCTNSVADLPLGAGCAAYLCDARAKVLFPLWIYHVRLGDGRHALWVETAAGHSSGLLAHLDRYLIADQVEMVDVSARFSQFHLVGPQAPTLLSQAIGDTVPELAPLAHMERTIGAVVVHIRCFPRLELPGYDIVVLREHAAEIYQRFMQLGAFSGESSAWETLRIEAGWPLFGVDYDQQRNVTHLPRLSEAVSYSKGCYPGQEPIVMSRDRAGHPTSTFVGLRVRRGGPPPPGARLIHQQKDVGYITSSTYSPRWGGILALGYLRWGYHTPQQIVELGPEDGSRAAEVLGPPPFFPAQSGSATE